LYLEADNVPKTLFLFVKRRLGPGDGLVASTSYKLKWDITYASKIPKKCPHVSHDGGEVIYLKAGGSLVQPRSIQTDSGDAYQLNVDKGHGGVGGPNATVVGNIGLDSPCNPYVASYKKFDKTHTHSQPISTDSFGHLWLLAGIDSQYNFTKNSIYFLQLKITLVPVG